MVMRESLRKNTLNISGKERNLICYYMLPYVSHLKNFDGLSTPPHKRLFFSIPCKVKPKACRGFTGIRACVRWS
jgi:hypothetical protein